MALPGDDVVRYLVWGFGTVGTELVDKAVGYVVWVASCVSIGPKWPVKIDR